MSISQKALENLTQEYVQSKFTYDHGTGVCIWINCACSALNGKVVGTVVKSKVTHSCYNVGLDGVYHKLHRLIWLHYHGEHLLEFEEIDHINGCGTDNRISNLRKINHHMNLKNRPLQHNNKTGLSGVTLTRNGRYHVMVGKRSSSNNPYKGRFDNIFDAACCRISNQNKLNYHENHGRGSTRG